jgi:hypothetical protein
VAGKRERHGILHETFLHDKTHDYVRSKTAFEKELQKRRTVKDDQLSSKAIIDLPVAVLHQKVTPRVIFGDQTYSAILYVVLEQAQSHYGGKAKAMVSVGRG